MGLSSEKLAEKRKKQRPVRQRSKAQNEGLKVRDEEYLKQLKLMWGIKCDGKGNNKRSGV